MAFLDLHDLLAYAVERGASDLHVRAGSPPFIRINGRLEKTEFATLSEMESRKICYEVMTDVQIKALEERGEVDFAHSHKMLGRFRLNVFIQKGVVSLACRRVLPSCPPIEALGLPPAVRTLAEEMRGLILVTGPTSSGKTTTTGSMIDHINSIRPCHILTIEDPIEILHQDKVAIVNQREVGSDTSDFVSGLRSAMRQAPDVIFIGEIRDIETVTAAIQAAESGHLVISTIHTSDATETVNRIIDLYEPHLQAQVRNSLASSLKGIVSQRLLPKKDGTGQIPATEILVMNDRVRELIAEPDKTHLLPDLIAESSFYGMRTFDQSLLSLFRSGLVGIEDALGAATNLHDFKLALKQEGLQAVS